MDLLLDLARGDDFQRLLEVAKKDSKIQGVALDYDWWWLLSWRYFKATGLHGGPPFLSHPWDWTGSHAPGNIMTFAGDKPDPYWRPNWWKHYSDSTLWKEKQPPVRVKICLFPGVKDSDRPFIDQGPIDFPVTYEVRPSARLASSEIQTSPKSIPIAGGDSIGARAVSGTLGGLLQGPRHRYAVTCSHVLSKGDEALCPAPRDGAGARFVGMCTHASPLDPLGSQDVDIALVQLEEACESSLTVNRIGPVRALVPRSAMSPGQRARFMGKVSKLQDVEIGELNLTYLFPDHDGKRYYRFDNLFAVQLPHQIVASLPGNLHLVRGSPVQPGDSGAWVIQDYGRDLGWSGMIIGTDQLRGFAAFSETTMSWIEEEALAVQLGER